MATTIKKTNSGETKYTIQFDSPPTAQQLRKAIADLPDITVAIRRVDDANNGQVKMPVRFVFISTSQSEEDITPT